jgi:hypothetical protein
MEIGRTIMIRVKPTTLVIVALAGLAVLLATLPAPRTDDAVQAQEPKPAPQADALSEIKVVQRVNQATDRAMRYLASKQKPDGSWSANQAVNALALLAFLGRGHVPGRGPYRDVLERGKRYLVTSARADGLIASAGKPMYEHGLATLALAELYGMDPDPALEKALRNAVDLILKSQAPNGGWRYQPVPGDHDLSVAVMQIVALRAANNAEIPVPGQTIEKAIAYVRSCAHPGGGFGYTGPGQGPQTTAAGVLSLQLLGKYDDPSIPKALDYLVHIPIDWDASGPSYFYYFHYYAIQALYQAGGKQWDGWHPRIRELLLEKQNADGSWDCPPGTRETENIVGPDRIYWTAMGSLVLDIYMHFLPAYQR